MKVEVRELRPPIIEVGEDGNFTDPKVGLEQAGPFSLRFGRGHKSAVRVGLVGTVTALPVARAWFRRCSEHVASGSDNATLYPDFPGFQKTFRSRFDVEPRWTVELRQEKIDAVLQKRPTDRFNEMLKMYGDAVGRLGSGDSRPDVVVCYLGDDVARACRTVDNPRLSGSERKWVRRLENDIARGQIMLFDDWMPEETADDLLRRDFRRALKAQAMKHKMPIQIGTNRLFVDSESAQDPATRAWNVCLALFYKAGGIPWRMRSEGPETCFVGVSFHHLKTKRRHLVYASVAQAFSSEGDGFALRGDTPVEWDPEQGRQPHLSRDQATALARRVLAKYEEITERRPLRVVFHKTSKFEPEERAGIEEGAAGIPVVELVTIQPSRFRLIHEGIYPPRRGTYCRINEDASYLFTTGYIPEWRTYPGPHVPAPIRLLADPGVDLERAAVELLSLSRMNWNTARDTSGQPITIRFAREVGGIMAEVKPGEEDSSYRYYM
jgi:hypothetical protein